MSKWIDKWPAAPFIKKGVMPGLPCYRFNICDFIKDEGDINIGAMFVTTGCALQKTNYLLSCLREIKSPQIVKCQGLLKLLIKCADGFVWLETEWFKGQLYVITKTPRSIIKHHTTAAKKYLKNPPIKKHVRHVAFDIFWDKWHKELKTYIKGELERAGVAVDLSRGGRAACGVVGGPTRHLIKLNYKLVIRNTKGTTQNPKAKSLKSWIGRQKCLYRKGKLSKDKIRKLERLPGWAWWGHVGQHSKPTFDEIWNGHYAKLKTWVGQHGDYPKLNNNPTKQKPGIRLAQWMMKMRSDYMAGTLRPDRIEQLELLPDWKWWRCNSPNSPKTKKPPVILGRFGGRGGRG